MRSRASQVKGRVNPSICGNSKCKGLRVRQDLLYLRSRKKTITEGVLLHMERKEEPKGRGKRTSQEAGRNLAMMLQ